METDNKSWFTVAAIALVMAAVAVFCAIYFGV